MLTVLACVAVPIKFAAVNVFVLGFHVSVDESTRSTLLPLVADTNVG